MKKEEIELIQEKDKKGKGSGTKDACYHKVKSRYSVWPSAYASGALVKCRKVGAANWGNKSEGLSWDQLTEKCWPGYEKKGMKTMFGKRYPNCVKKKATRKESVEEAVRLPAKTGNIIDVHFVFRGRSFMVKMFFPKVGIPTRTDVSDQINKVYPGAKLTFFRVSDYEPGQPLFKVTEERTGEVSTIDEVATNDATTSGEILEDAQGTLDEMEKPLSPQEIALQKKKGQIDMQILKKRNQALRKDADEMKKEEAILEKSAAWTRKAGKNKEGGLNEKGRKSYERENPGSDLKAPSKKVGNKRRASFCARMKGMKKKLTSAKTANDPDSRINKSLRAWNC